MCTGPLIPDVYHKRPCKWPNGVHKATAPIIKRMIVGTNGLNAHDIADKLGVAVSTVYSYGGDGTATRHMPADYIIPFSIMTNRNDLVRFFCEALGGVFVRPHIKRHTAAGVSDLLKDFARALDDYVQARDPASEGGERRSVALYSVVVAGDLTLSVAWDGSPSLTTLRATALEAALELGSLV